MDTELNIFQEYWQRFCSPWSKVAFVLYFVFVIVVFGGLGVIFAVIYDIDSPTKIGYVASNLSTYAIALLVPSIITMILSSHKISHSFNIVSSVILLVVILGSSFFGLHFSNVHKEYSVWTAIVIAIVAWILWVIANSDNAYLSVGTKIIITTNNGMNMSQNNKIIGQVVTQNSQEFIIGVFTIGQILRFTKYTKRLIAYYNDDERPVYNNHVQREVEKSRVEKIADFLINDPLASFPTNIVLGIPIISIEEQEIIVSKVIPATFIEITLKDNVFEEIQKEDGNVFITIIDGQHRIRGIEVAIERLQKDIDNLMRTIRASDSIELQKKLTKARKRLEDLNRIELAVSFFIDPIIEYQAMIFSTINRTQKRVSQNLVYSLFGLDINDTPQKTALETTLSLNTHPASPFYKRVNLYGGNYAKNQSPPLSQATMIRSIVNLISENTREEDNDRNKKRTELLRQSDRSTRFLPFRYFYARNQDNMISNILFYYYNAVRKVYKMPDGKPYWDISNNIINNILQTTVGYEALLKVLCDILEIAQFEKNLDFLSDDDFYQIYLNKASSIDFFDRDRYPFSTRGRNRLYLEMSLLLFPHGTFKNDRRQERLNELLEEQL